MSLSTRTLLFSDIEGSTSLLDRGGTDYPPLLSEHRRLVRAAVANAGGVEHSTEGDSFFITFDSPTAGVAAAVDAQLALESHPWPDGLRLRVRMALHVGEVLEDDNDLVGMSIHHAARIAATAHGGQIVLSEAVRDMARTLPNDVTIRSLGMHQLRDAGTVELFQLEHPALQRDFPPPRGATTPRTNTLPRTTTPFVGGDSLMSTVEEQFAIASLVTLTGTGGVGKTRAAVEYAWRHVDDHPHGAHFVDLAPITERGAVVGAITDVLPVVAGGGDEPLDTLTAWISDRQLLLVLDNCEHLVAEVASVVDTLVSACPNLRLLTTSREALGVRSERVVRVPSLDPGTEAVDLFVQRALAADASFRLDGHRGDVVQICTRLDGIPLAIELAAARVRSLAPSELLARLEDRFRLLRGSGRGTLDRHHTLRAMVTWSYQLLTPDEQTLLDRLSVFAGGFDLAAAEAVCGFDPLDDMDVVDLLSSLVDKSMVVADRGMDGTRYRLLETIRQFGEERLDAGGGSAPLRDRHARHVTDVIEALGAMVMGREELLGARRMNEEWDNLRAAHQWALAERDLDLAERLVLASFDYADLQMRFEHGMMTARTVELGEEMERPSTEVISRLCCWLSVQGEEETNLRFARRALEVAPWPDHWTTAMCWFELAGASPLSEAGSVDVRDAFQHMKAAVDHHPHLERDWLVLVQMVDASLWAAPEETDTMRRRLDDLAARVQAPRLITFALIYEGHARLADARDPDFEGALTIYRRALESARAADDLQHEAVTLRALALASAGLGSVDAPARCRDALVNLFDMRYWQKLWQAMDSTLLALTQAGHHAAAATVLGHLDAHMPSCGIEHSLGFRDRARSLLDPSEHAADMKAGARMTTDEVVQAAIDWCGVAASDEGHVPL